jgi:hypothetical protein
MRPLTVMILAHMCMAQDPEFREGVHGRWVASLQTFPGWAEFERLPLSQCLRERQWVPKSLCASATALDTGDPKKLDAWWQDNANYLRSLEPVFRFYGQVAQERPAVTPCPNIAVQTEAPPRAPGVAIESVDLLWAGEYEGDVHPFPRVTLVRNTDRIAAAVGVHFGIYFKIAADPAEGILTVLSTTSVPEPGLPGGSTAVRQRVVTDRPQCVLGKPCLVGFEFEREDEILPGEWQFEVSFRGKTLIEHRFTVYRKEPAAPGQTQSGD